MNNKAPMHDLETESKDDCDRQDHEEAREDCPRHHPKRNPRIYREA